MESHLEKKTPAEKINEYAALIWNWAWLLILCALLAGGTAYWASKRQTPVYQASALVLIACRAGNSDSYLCHADNQPAIGCHVCPGDDYVSSTG